MKFYVILTLLNFIVLRFSYNKTVYNGQIWVSQRPQQQCDLIQLEQKSYFEAKPPGHNDTIWTTCKSGVQSESEPQLFVVVQLGIVLRLLVFIL